MEALAYEVKSKSLYMTFNVFQNCMCVYGLLSHVQLIVTPWTVACQAPLSMKFSGQEYCSGLPFPPPGELPDPGMEPISSALKGGVFTTEPPGKPM